MHAGYRRPGPVYRWQNWWGVMLIDSDDERDLRAVLRAEDEAIAAVEAGPQPAPADLATLTELMREDEGPAGVAQPDRWNGD